MVHGVNNSEQDLLTLLLALWPQRAPVAVPHIFGMQSQFAPGLQLLEPLSEIQWGWTKLQVRPCVPVECMEGR